MHEILALDPSLRGTGYCRTLDNFGSLMYTGKGHTVGKDLLNIFDKLKEIYIGDPFDILIREGYAFGYDNDGKNRIIEVGGVTKLFAEINGEIPIIDVPPRTLKKIICDDGKATKDQVMATISELTGRTLKDDNQSDAMALWLIGQAYASLVQRSDFGKISVASIGVEIRDNILKENWKI